MVLINSNFEQEVGRVLKDPDGNYLNSINKNKGSDDNSC